MQKYLYLDSIQIEGAKKNFVIFLVYVIDQLLLLNELTPPQTDVEQGEKYFYFLSLICFGVERSVL